jgi:PKD repeat protein
MVMNERLAKVLALLVFIALVGAVQAADTGITSKSGYIEVGLYPYADFTANPVSGAPPLAVAFTDKSTGSTPRTYQWNFGDGGTSDLANPTHTYAAAGVYSVTLTITNSYGSDSETKSEYVRVGGGPVADFTGLPQSGTVPLAVAFQDMSTGNPATWKWDFGDGGASTDRNPSHTYSKAGTYGVSLTVTNAFGSSTKTKASFITAGTPPTADFTGLPKTGPVPLAVKFADASTGRPTSWAWDFGDGTTSSQQSPSHVYTKAGAYTVTLTVKNAYGSDTESKTGFVNAGAALAAEFTADQRIGTAPLTVRFTDLSAGGPTSWFWNFGDGTTSSEQNPTHVYKVEGTYDVSLTVANSFGTDTEKKTGSGDDTCIAGMTGYIIVGRTPTADFSANPVSGASPLAVAFTDKSTGVTPMTYQWTFGDGGTSSAINPTHTYTADGIYSVTLTVSNAFGSDSETKEQLIRVGKGPVADFTGLPQSGQLPLAVAFTDMSTGDPTTWRWDFGDGVTSSERNPSHTYNRAGTYGVSLTVSNNFGRSTKVKAGFITTGMPPTADFTSLSRAGSVPLAVKFTDASTGGPTSWAWEFGDGGKSSDRNPTHVYTKAGTYTVTLTVTNTYGSDSETKTGFVSAGGKPDAEFTADERRGVKPFTVTFTDLSTGNPTTWAWDFGDGTTSMEQNPVHIYQKEGYYDVSLTVSNSYGTDTEKKTGAAPGVSTLPAPVPGQTIVEKLVADGRFKTLVAAVQAAKLDGTLSGAGPFTVFAPTDAAFAKLPAGTVDNLLKDPEGQLKQILLYHVASGSVKAADVVKISSVKTVQGGSAAVTVTKDGVMVDGAKVTQTDIIGSNGVIHVIDAVMIPPTEATPGAGATTAAPVSATPIPGFEGILAITGLAVLVFLAKRH